MKSKTTILLADDHAVLRAGLRLLLSQEAHLEVIGEAESGLETLRLAEELQPDLILLDISMPGLNGLEAISLLRKRVPQTRILILTMHDDVHYLRQALQNGASGYVLKKAADVELLSAIQAVMQGEIYVHSSMTRSLLEDILPVAQSTPPEQWDLLSEREKEVLRLVAYGYTSQEIADQLGLSAKTIETYRARGMEKLGLSSRAALVRFALSKGLISAE
ncbi:MAG: two-component response regulator [Anaerolineae bacterium]|jgi:DNA-binding NarL/FixJ family response regulator|nr:MAG: two-component response regulator [Anaerolineae bacterium]